MVIFVWVDSCYLCDSAIRTIIIEETWGMLSVQRTSNADRQEWILFSSHGSINASHKHNIQHERLTFPLICNFKFRWSCMVFYILNAEAFCLRLIYACSMFAFCFYFKLYLTTKISCALYSFFINLLHAFL